jgi:hypothetical protein
MTNSDDDIRKSILRREIQESINRLSLESNFNTHDWILGEYLVDCLEVFDKAVRKRDKAKR